MTNLDTFEALLTDTTLWFAEMPMDFVHLLSSFAQTVAGPLDLGLIYSVLHTVAVGSEVDRQI